MGPPLRVLMLGPLSGRDASSGDTTYTQTLLDNPPPGVVYTAYDRALADGSLVLRARKPWSHGWNDLGLTALRTAELAARRLGTTYREQIWWASVSDQYDLVHQHLFGLRQVSSRVPSLSSVGYPLGILYTERNGWSAARVGTANRIDTILTRGARASVPGVWATGANWMTVYTEYHRELLVARGHKHVAVLRQALPDVKPRLKDPQHLTFIGRDFVRKGGPVAVEAFRRLSLTRPTLRLTVVTSAGDARRIPDLPGLDARFNLERPEVLSDILPRTSLLLLPTHADCGAPYAVLEALRIGVPVLASTSDWMDSLLALPSVAVCSPNVDSVVRTAEPLLDTPGRLSELGTAGRELFERTYAMPRLHSDLGKLYERVLGGY